MYNPVKYNSSHSLIFHQQVTPTCEVDIHMHDTYEIFQALSDNIRYFVEGRSYDLAKGDIIITSSHEIHRPITTNQQPYGRRFIQFDPTLVQTFLDIPYNPIHIFENRKLGYNNQIQIPSLASSLVDKFFATIEASLISSSPRSHYEGWLTLHSFLIELELLYEASHAEKTKMKPVDSNVLKIKNYLDQHYTEPFHLDILSKMHHIDKFHLSRLFKESTGFTLLEYIQSKRIRHAINLLATPQTILEISQLCGYDDYTNFYKTFKKMTKLSPKEYRDSLIGVC